MEQLSDAIVEIRQRKSATITLNELAGLCVAHDYSALVSIVSGFVDGGLLRPMGSETNGMFPPLCSRYRILRAKGDMSGAKDEILRLGPEFNPSGYLSNVPLYIKHRELLRGLVEYVRYRGTELTETMSRNERAYAIWGNEKQLDDSVCKSMLRFTGWECRLNYYNTPEPFMDYLCNGAETEAVLILENKDIWFSLRKLLMESGGDCLLYGRKVDGLLYGEGKKITRNGALEEYSNEGFSKSPSFYYWGDLDYEGIGIFLAISAFPLQLFTPAYAAMLEYGRAQTLTQCRASQLPPPQIGRFYEQFDDASAAEIRTLLESGKYIPQEICNYPRLREALDVTR